MLAFTGDGAWRRRGVALRPLPDHRSPGGTAIRVYLEIDGLARDEPLRLTIMAVPESGATLRSALRDLIGARLGFELTFDDVARLSPDGVAALDFEMQPGLRPGDYQIHLEVRRLTTGEVLSASTNLAIH